MVATAIQRLFSAYRRDDFADAEGFVAQLGVVLCDFPEEVVEYITSPKTGLQRRSKWPPTLSEIIAACEAHQAFLARIRVPQPIMKRLPPPPPKPLDVARVFVADSHPSYDNVVDWAKTLDEKDWRLGKSPDGRAGIFVPEGVTQLLFKGRRQDDHD